MFSAVSCGLTCTSWSSQWERLKDLTLLTSGMLRWIPEQARQMNTPREHEPQLGSAEKEDGENKWSMRTRKEWRVWRDRDRQIERLRGWESFVWWRITATSLVVDSFHKSIKSCFVLFFCHTLSWRGPSTGMVALPRLKVIGVKWSQFGWVSALEPLCQVEEKILVWLTYNRVVSYLQHPYTPTDADDGHKYRL